MKFTLLRFFATCIFLQTISAASHPDLNTDELEYFKYALNLGVKVIQRGYKWMDDIVLDYMQHGKERDQQIINLVEGIGYRITDEIIQELGKLFDEMEPAVNKNGKKAIECIRDEKQPVFKAVNSSVLTITECVLGQIPDIFINTTTDWWLAVNATINIIADANEQLDSCKLGEVDCWNAFLSYVAEIRNEIEPIAKGTKEFKEGINKVKDATIGCFMKAEILQNIVNILDETVRCISS